MLFLQLGLGLMAIAEAAGVFLGIVIIVGGLVAACGS